MIDLVLTDRLVVEALVNVWRALHEFAVVVLTVLVPITNPFVSTASTLPAIVGSQSEVMVWRDDVAFAKFCKRDHELAVVVPNAIEIAGVAPPEDTIGYVPVTLVTPLVVDVAMILPLGSTARRAPAGVPREVSHAFELTVKRLVLAFEKLCSKDHVLAVVVPKASAIVPVVVIGPPVTGYVVAILVTVPELLVKHTPLTDTHPALTTIPFPKVEVPVVVFIRDAEIPAAKLDVAVVEVDVM